MDKTQCSPLRVGLVGSGSIAQVHAGVLAALPPELVHFTAACDPRPERAQAMAEAHGIHAYSSMEAMLESEPLDAVHLCTPHDLHVLQAIAALRQGIHVLSEKPAGISLIELDALEEAVTGSIARYAVCLQNRYLPAVCRARELISSVTLGKVLGSRAMVSWRREGSYYSESGWRGTWAHEGGSAMINQAIHTLDLQCLLCGQPTRMDGTMHNLHLQDQTETEDTCQLRLEFPGGAVGLFHASISYATDAPVLLEVHGEHGTLRLEGDDLYVRIGGAPWQAEPLPKLTPPGKLYWGAGHGLLIRDFYEALAEDSPFPISFHEGTRVLKLLLQIYDAHRGAF